MKHFIEQFIRYRRSGIVLLLAVTLLLSYAILNITINADFSTYLRADDPVVQQFNLIGEVYASKSLALVLIEADNVFHPETLRLVDALTDGYEALDDVAYVTSLTNATDIKDVDGSIEIGRLVSTWELPESQADSDRLKGYVLSKERYVRDIVSEDGRLTAIVIRLMPDVYEFMTANKIKEVTEAIAPNLAQISYGGLPFMMHQMTLNIMNNVTYLQPAMFLLMIGVLFLGFRKAGGVVLPLAVVAFTILWTLGLMAIFDLELNMLTALVPVLLIAMGSADGIHIMKRYYEKRQEGSEPVEAIRDAFAEMNTPIILTTVTTMVGFLSLIFSDFDVVKEFGIVTTLGIFLALVATFMIIPVLLSFSTAKPMASQAQTASVRKNRMTHAWGHVIFHHKGKILILTTSMVLIAVMLIPLLKKSVDWSLCLPKGSKSHRAEMLLREHFGGTVPVQFLVNGPIKNAATLKVMRYLERYVDSVPEIGETHSIADIMAEMNEIIAKRYLVPETSAAVANLWFLIETEEIMEQLVREDEVEGLIQAKLGSWDTEILANAMEQVQQFVATLPEKLFIINLAEASPDSTEALLRIRTDRIADTLLWDLQKHGIAVERTPLSNVVAAALSEPGDSEQLAQHVRQAVMRYLLGPIAEVASITDVQAATVADVLIIEIGKSDNFAEDAVFEHLATALPYVESEEDVQALASSLTFVMREAIGEVRVASALDALLALLPAGTEQNYELLKTLNGDLWEMNERLVVVGNQDYETLAAPVKAATVEEIPIAVESTGLAAVLKRMEEELLPSQAKSLVVALIVVALMMSLIFRSFSVGMISMLPTTLTILVNFAVMAVLDIGLDSFTAMIASIAIGLGIDTDIHFISSLKQECSKFGDTLRALQATFATTGVAILINALTVGLGFAVLLLAGGQHVRRFGGLVSLTILLSALLSLSILPAVLLLVKPAFLRAKGPEESYIARHIDTITETR